MQYFYSRTKVYLTILQVNVTQSPHQLMSLYEKHEETTPIPLKVKSLTIQKQMLVLTNLLITSK